MASWLTVNPVSGTTGTGQTITITALENKSSSQRKATLVFRAGNAVHKIDVIQKNTQQPSIESLVLSLGTSSLKFNDSVVITAKSENSESIKWAIESSVKDKSQDIKDASRYVATNISENDNTFTVSYKKTKIESDTELGDVQSLILTVTASTVSSNTGDTVDYKTITLKLYSELVKKVSTPVVEVYNTTPTSVTFLINPAPLEDNVNEVADIYYVYCGTSTSLMPLVSVQNLGSSTTGITYTYNIKDGSPKAYIKVSASYSGGGYLDSNISEVVVGDTGGKTVLDTPVIGVMDTTPATFKIRWNEVEGATKYRVFVSPDYYDNKSNDFPSIETLKQAVIDNPDALASHTVIGLSNYDVIARKTNEDKHPDEDTNYLVCVVAMAEEESGYIKSFPGSTSCEWIAGREDNYFVISCESKLPTIIPSSGYSVNNWLTVVRSGVDYNVTGVESFITLKERTKDDKTTYDLIINENTDSVMRGATLSIIPSGDFATQKWEIKQEGVKYDLFLSKESQNIRNDVKETSFKLFMLRNDHPEDGDDVVEVTSDSNIIDAITVKRLSDDSQGATHLVTLSINEREFTEPTISGVINCKSVTKPSLISTFVLNILNSITPYIPGVDIYTMCPTNRQWSVGVITTKNGIHPDPENLDFTCASKSLVVVFNDNVAPSYKCQITLRGVYYDGYAYGSTNTVGIHEFSYKKTIIPSKAVINNSESSGAYYNGVSIANGLNLGIKTITDFKVEKIEE